MIKLFLNNYLLPSGIFLLAYATIFSYNMGKVEFWIAPFLAITLSAIIDASCKNLSIIGLKTRLTFTIFIFTLAGMGSTLNVSQLTLGIIWLVILYAVFREYLTERALDKMFLFLGILIGVAQCFNPWSFVAWILVFIGFIRHNPFTFRHFLLGFTYFVLVILLFLSALYITDMWEERLRILPIFNMKISVEYTFIQQFFIVITFILFLLSVILKSNFRFRYPNKYLNIQNTLTLFFVVGLFPFILLRDNSFLLWILFPLAIIMATFFTAYFENYIVNGVFLFYLFVALVSFYFQSVG